MEELEQRLSAADLHMISLRPGWEGTVVPSKFFGALAAGKPVLYDGVAESDIGVWVDDYDLGVLLTDSNLESAAQRLIDFAHSRDDLHNWQQRALDVYRKEFSREHVLDQWDQTLRTMLNGI